MNELRECQACGTVLPDGCGVMSVGTHLLFCDQSCQRQYMTERDVDMLLNETEVGGTYSVLDVGTVRGEK